MKKNLYLLLGLLLSFFLLYLVFGRINYQEFWQTLKGAKLSFLGISLILLFIHMGLRAWRWKILLKPVKEARFSSLLGAFFIGFMANNFLPARMGDVIRGYLIGKTENFSKTSSFAVLIAEKFLDGFTILSSFAVFSFTLRKLETHRAFYNTLLFSGYFSLILFLLTLLAFLLIKYAPEKFMKLTKPSGWSERAKTHLFAFRDGLKWFDQIQCLIPSLTLSYLSWLSYALGIHWTAMAFSVNIPFIASFLGMIAVCVVTTLPFTPGYIGTYHAALSYSLILYDVSMEEAAAISLVFHALFFSFTTFMGLFYLWHYHISFSSLKKPLKE